ncbi:hypothetical protein D3C86_1169830 [compost metagenome]
MPFYIRREEQPGEETEDHGRHRFHQLDHRLDLAAHARGHEVRGVDRSGNGQWSSEQHGVERSFQSAEGQWRQAQFRFEIGVGGGRLPDVFWLVVVLVPDLAPQRAPGNFRVRVVEQKRLQLAVGFDDDTVGTWRQTEHALAFYHLIDQQGAMRGAVEHAKLAASIQSKEALATLFGSDFNDRRGAHLESADLLQAQLTIGVTGHEPLGQTTLGVTDDQRDTTDQLRGRGDFGVSVFQQFVATVEALVAQAEHIGLSATVDHVQPLLARVDEDVFHRLSHLRQIDTLLLVGDFASHHVFFAGQRQHIELRTGRTDQHQRRVGGVQADMLQRAAGFVQRDRRLAIRILDGRADGFLAIGVADFIGVTEHQRLTVGQTHGHQWMARLVFTNRGHGCAGRHWQIDALQFSATVDIKEQCLAFVGNAHGHLILLFERNHQWLAGVLHPGRGDRVFRGEVGTLKQRRDHVGEEEKDQGNGCQHRETANEDVPAGEAILERTNAALALQLRRIEVNALGRISSHLGIGQIIHALTLAILYDRKMTMQ